MVKGTIAGKLDFFGTAQLFIVFFKVTFILLHSVSIAIFWETTFHMKFPIAENINLSK